MTSVKDSSFFCSWSGGKDSCLALYHAIHQGGKPTRLLTMLTETGQRSRSHGLPVQLVEHQAHVLGIPLTTRAASWRAYESTFMSAVSDFRKDGAEFGVFGDIDIDAHREWCEKVCFAANVSPYHPLWQRDRYELLEEFLALGFSATIIAVKEGVLDREFLGKVLDADVVRALESTGIDASGEQGEYHTVVTGGPLFSSPIHLERKGQVLHDGYWFLDVCSSPPTL